MAKSTPKLVLQLQVILAISSASINHDCSDNCYQCLGKINCFGCYDRIYIDKFEGNYFCSSTIPPASDHCSIYTNAGCDRCQPGWALKFNYAKNIYLCVKGTIKDCVDEENTDMSIINHLCHACLEGYPSTDQSKCIPASKFNNHITHCKVGSK